MSGNDQLSLENENAAFPKAVLLALEVLPKPTPTSFRLNEYWLDYQRMLPQLLALHSQYTNSETLVANSEFAELMFYRGWYLVERQETVVALPLLRTAKKIYDQNDPTPNWFIYSRILQGLGGHYLTDCQYKVAESYYRQALEIGQSHTNPENVLLAHLNQCIGLSLTGQGRYTEAITFQNKALAIADKSEDDFTRRDMTFTSITTWL